MICKKVSSQGQIKLLYRFPSRWWGNMSFHEIIWDCLVDDLSQISPLQIWLGCLLAVMILANGIIALILWSKYGRMISERFMKPATNRSLEEFKKEAMHLRVPIQHSPRIWIAEWISSWSWSRNNESSNTPFFRKLVNWVWFNVGEMLQTLTMLLYIAIEDLQQQQVIGFVDVVDLAVAVITCKNEKQSLPRFGGLLFHEYFRYRQHTIIDKNVQDQLE